MKILNAEPLGFSPAAFSKLQKLGEVVDCQCDRKRLMAEVVDAHVLIVRLANYIDSEVMDRGKNLKAIVTATTGLNHIDLSAAQEKGIAVLSLKGERAFLETLTATAELTWGLLLGLVRQLPTANQSVRDGFWVRDQFRGAQLKDKTLGVVGFGRLGSIVARYGQAFNMNVIVSDPFVNAFPDYARAVDFETLLRQSDIISLHVNLDESTYGLLDSAAIKSIRPGAILVNTSRGELIDEEALVDALRKGRIAGVVADVLSGEVSKSPNWLQNNPLWRYAQECNNVIISPHIGGATVESMEDAELFVVEKLRGYLLASGTQL